MSASDDYSLTKRSIEAFNYNHFTRIETYLVVLGKLSDDLTDPTVNKQSKISKLVNLAESFIASNQEHELNYLLANLHALILKRFYQPCIGKLSYDECLYHQYSSILRLLSSSSFTIRRDQRMSISNVNYNAVYQEHYLQTPPGTLQNEMLNLANILDLDFSSDSDFDNEIIFTIDCTKRLKESGLHINENYMKLLFKKMNQWSLFRQAHQQNDDNHRLSDYFHTFPIELTSIISNELNPNLAEDEGELIKIYSRP